MTDSTLGDPPGFLAGIAAEDGRVLGSGFQISPGLVVTCRHVIDSLEVGNVPAVVQVVEPRTGRSQRAGVWLPPVDVGLALLICEEPLTDSVRSFVTSADIMPGEAVELLATAPGGRFTRIAGTWRAAQALGDAHGWLVSVAPLATPRLSGSPVVRTQDGTLAGVLLGAMPGTGDIVVVPGEHVIQLIDEAVRGSFRQPGRPGDKTTDLEPDAYLAFRLGESALESGDADNAESAFRHAMNLFERAGSVRGQAFCQVELGRVAFLRGDFQNAHDMAGRAVRLVGRSGDERAVAMALLLQGNADEMLGEFSEATNRYRNAQEIFARSGDRHANAYTCLRLGVVAVRQGEGPHAYRYLHEASTLFGLTDDHTSQAESLLLLGQVAQADAQYEEALTHYRRALGLFREVGDRRQEAAGLLRIGQALASISRSTEAIEVLGAALYAFQSIGDTANTWDALAMLSATAEATGEHREALRYLRKAVDLGADARSIATRIEQLTAHNVEFGDGSASGASPRETALPDDGAAGGLGPGEPPGAEVGGDGDEPQIINIWVDERADNPAVPLSVRKRYTLVFRVGMPRGGNLARGDRAIPRTDIPPGGLPTQWIVSSTDVVLGQEENDPDVRLGTAISGDTAQWMASFGLTVPAAGDSEERRLSIVPLGAGRARINVSVSIADDLYRTLTVDLAVSPPASMPPALTPPVPAGTGAPAPGGATPVLTTTVGHSTPLRHIAPEPSAVWQIPDQRLDLEFRRGQVHQRCEPWGLDAFATWAPDCGLVRGQITRVREALDVLRVKQAAYFEGIEPVDLAARLAAYRPRAAWTAPSTSGDAWADIAGSAELHALADEGHVLYQAIFADEGLRAHIERLRPGDMLSLTWFPDGGEHVAHVPWALMYREPPALGEPIDPENFLGVRLRLRSMSHEMRTVRALGLPENRTTRAHLMYWGDEVTDPVAVEARRHVEELGRWQPYVLPTCRPGKAEVARFLGNPEPAPVGLVYLYCRSVAGDQGGAGFRFGNGPADQDAIMLGEIGSRPIPDRPLIFANACGTSAASRYVPNELEQRFFVRGCSAFLGTECRVPITFAARFAAAFFHFLYTNDGRPTPAGEALAQARRFFWDEYGSIGGLFYSYVNDYHLYVATDEEVAALSRLKAGA